MNKAPKRLLPHGLRTISTYAVPERGEVTQYSRKKLELGIKHDTYNPQMVEKSFWDHKTQTVKTVQVSKNLERQEEIVSGKRYLINRKKAKKAQQL